MYKYKPLYELKVNYRDEHRIKVSLLQDNQTLERSVLDNINEVEDWLKEWFPVATLIPITDKPMTADQRWYRISPISHTN